MKLTPKVKALRKRYADRQRRIRSARDRKKRCRTCGDPAVMSERTGKLAKQCARHLGCDANRKKPYLLAWEDGGELVYPLGQIP